MIMKQFENNGVTSNETTVGEFERSPVPNSKLKNWKSFVGMYAGEHAAGTEFMIGPLFLTAGVSAFDLIFGLLLGNLLAVLSWRFLTAEIAVKNRLTLYFQLEKICGKKLVIGYNLANGILFCFLAGSMITVSATAVGIPFDMPMPKLTDTLPNGTTWIVIVLLIGLLISVIAAKGYDTVAKAANWMSPIIVIAFLACGVVALGQLGVSSFSDFCNIWGEGTEPFPGQIKYTFGMSQYGHGLPMLQCILECLICQYSDMPKRQKQDGQPQQECI
jgi:purine-cytosine permease-like protein